MLANLQVHQEVRLGIEASIARQHRAHCSTVVALQDVRRTRKMLSQFIDRLERLFAVDAAHWGHFQLLGL